jgi:hypothetical protein
MRTALRLTATALAALALAGCQNVPETSAADTLVATRVATPPRLEAGADDPAWQGARALAFDVSGGANFGGKGETRVTMKALYSPDTLYLLIQYADPTQSVRRGPYQKQADGRWVKLKDPADKGGDDNVFYEDKWAMIWPIANSIPNWDKRGCMALCHEETSVKPYGNKYTEAEGQIVDMWHFKGSRTAPWGFVDDQYTDHTRYDAKASPSAGRKSDPGTIGGEYNNFPLVGGKPQFMARDARPLNAGGTAYIRRGEEVPFDDSRFKAGDEVASYIVNPLQGDRADVRVAATWKNGVYTSVVSRRLVTGSRFDVQFSDLSARYGFGFAAFDNAQVRHATSDDPMYLVFAK